MVKDGGFTVGEARSLPKPREIECPVEWYRVTHSANSLNLIWHYELVPRWRLQTSPTRPLSLKLAFRRAGACPRRQVPMTTLVPFNASVSELSRFGGGKPPPYGEHLILVVTNYYSGWQLFQLAEFNQTLRFGSWRAAGSRPYEGRVRYGTISPKKQSPRRFVPAG